MRRTGLLGGLLLSVFCVSAAAQPASVQASDETVILFSENRATSQHVASIARDTVLDVIAVSGDWYRVVAPVAGARREGWVHRSAVRVLNPGPMRFQPAEAVSEHEAILAELRAIRALLERTTRAAPSARSDSVPAAAMGDAGTGLQTSQVVPPAPPFDAGEHPWSIAGYGGMTFITEPDITFGARLTRRVTRWMDLSASFTQLQNIIPADENDQIEALGTLTSILVGVPVAVDAAARMTAVGGGARFYAVSDRGLEPYGLIGVSVGRVLAKARIQVFGLSPFDESESVMKAVVELGGGLRIPAGRVFIDTSYMYRRLLRTSVAFNISNASVGVGVLF